MPNIVIYSSSFCGYCHRAKQLLDGKDVAYNEIRVDRDPAKRLEMMEKSGRRTVPQIWINDLHIGGSDELSMLDRNGELDKLLAGLEN
ncbi:MAG: glutaredoxin 3 [Pseudomonadales bacterium]